MVKKRAQIIGLFYNTLKINRECESFSVNLIFKYN